MDTVKYPVYLEEAFSGSFTYTDEEDDLYNFYLHTVGNIHVFDGKIIACDALTLEADEAFTITFPKGEFPVELAIAKVSDDERVGFARIKFNEQSPVRWEYALVEGQDPESIENGIIFGYPVDSGVGSFMDTSGHEAFANFYENDPTALDTISDLLDKNYADTRSWAVWNNKNNNVIYFTTGWGDGTYQSYVGFDKDDKICRLVTDFGLLDWPE
ncbi:hypothetical protein COR50_03005 [Chitinophaga caeni]|uniref:DUF4241 domain-containing protein n=1 Tax=Chitinophaga caeni TaxID=2029983 RepID=A0A291QQE6_9BACT|nr:DUF4241 domain-containing protein [Chitinophaga caeni]ATL46218.1 hypothetical protein COR50_03005 [Chitinophaga caeni]